MSSPAHHVEVETAALSRTLSPEAVYYWERHQPRFRYLMELVAELRETHRLDRVLDIGMGFQTVMLSRLLPNSRVDCLGVYEDDRFRPAKEFTFYSADLNDLAVPNQTSCVVEAKFDLIVFMEVLEHLYTPPELVLAFLASRLNEGGVLILTTPNAAWLKNRLKLFLGKNPFELLKADRKNMGHIREYTKAELEKVLADVGLKKLKFERRGLYRFNNAKDNCYSRIAELTHPSLCRTLIAVYQKGSSG
jgi:SAM-dependent methyltransferase